MYLKKLVKKLDGKKRRKALIKACDKLVRQLVFHRDQNTCQYCGKQPEKLDPHHIYGRRIYSLRWVLDNLITLCSGCHMQIAHAQPVVFIEYIRCRLGDNGLDKLKLKKNSTFKTSVSNLELFKLKLERENEKIN